MANISKFSIDGVEYDVGESSGGLVGYSGSITDISNISGYILFQMEDGTVNTVATSSFDTTKKYTWIAFKVLNTNYGIASTTVEYHSIGSGTSTYWIIIPQVDNWNVIIQNYADFG